MAQFAGSEEGCLRLNRLEARVDHRLAEHIETHETDPQMAAAGRGGIAGLDLHAANQGIPQDFQDFWDPAGAVTSLPDLRPRPLGEGPPRTQRGLSHPVILLPSG